MKLKNSGIILAILITALLSCTTGNSSNESHSGNGNPKIKFEKLNHDIGELKAGEKVAVNFYFENTGNATLIIEDVITDCGCTTSDYEKKEIPAGETGKITIIFDSEGEMNNQYKTIKVITNATDSVTELHLAAFVQSKYQLNK